MSDDYTPSEMMVAAMARQIEDGVLLAMAIGTTLPNCAYYLAKLTHAPSAVFIYSVGGAFSQQEGPLSLAGVEELALGSPIRRASYSEFVCEQLAGLRFKEFARPAQVDRFGNTNNVRIETGREKPLRLPGASGLPDFQPYACYEGWLYVPRHDRTALVERLDFCSAVGAAPPAGRPVPRDRGDGRGFRRMVTDLGVFDFSPDGTRAASLHPGVTPEKVRESSSFAIEIADDVPTTAPPTTEELRLIREVIDPNGLRELELVSGRDRMPVLRSLLAREQTAAAG
jgi:acyl CoA:acetate/3-ketoacid CoA transferase beta subunit